MRQDCLFLNIFTPTQDALGVPVRIYIHGGWFSQGSASSGAALNDDYLKEACRMVSQTNTIFVTIQVRMGPFCLSPSALVSPARSASCMHCMSAPLATRSPSDPFRAVWVPFARRWSIPNREELPRCLNGDVG